MAGKRSRRLSRVVLEDLHQRRLDRDPAVLAALAAETWMTAPSSVRRSQRHSRADDCGPPRRGLRAASPPELRT